MCEISFDDHAAVWDERVVTARKTHRCSCCNGAIAPGQSYRTHFSVFDGDATYEKMCMACVNMAERFAADHHGSYGVPSFMPELLEQCIDEEGEASPTGRKWKGELDAIRARGAA